MSPGVSASREHRTAAGDPLLAARLVPPSVPDFLVRRQPLLDRLSKGVRGPLTLIEGVAGAGKTMLAAQWVTENAAAGPVCWLTCEPGETPETFWSYVLETLRLHGMPLPEDGYGPLRAEEGSHALLTRLASGLAGLPEPVVLVLDRFDAVSSREIAEELEFLLRHAAPRLRAVLTSRVDPLLPLHRYRAADEITEIRDRDLRFDDRGAGELLGHHGLDVPATALRVLVERTEGWTAGLRLCALAMEGTDDPVAFLQDFAADRTTIADYLLGEVLETLPAPTQDLLLRCSVVTRLHPGLADALTGRDDGAWTLARLARSHAFVERVGESPWYRIHPLFAEVLRIHLRYRMPGEEPALRRRAARWLAGVGQITDAVRQAAEAGDWAYAADQLVAGPTVAALLTGTESRRLVRLFSGMPPGLPGAAPALVSAALRLAAHDADGCAAGLRRAEAHLEGEPTDPTMAFTCAFLAVQAAALAGDPDRAEGAARSAGHWMRSADGVLARRPGIGPLLLSGLGAARLRDGRPEDAAAALDRAVEAAREEGSRHTLCLCLERLALAELHLGRLRSAERRAVQATALAERCGLPVDRRTGLGHLVLAAAAEQRGDLPRCRASLQRAAACPGRRYDPVIAAQAAVLDARLALADGDRAGALAALRAAQRVPGVRDRTGWESDQLAGAESAVHLASGDARAALAALGAVPSERPAHRLALAGVLLAAGRRRQAADLLAALPLVPVGAAASPEHRLLLRAQAAARARDHEEACLLLGRALAQAGPGELSLLATGGPWRPRQPGRSGQPHPPAIGGSPRRRARASRQTAALPRAGTADRASPAASAAPEVSAVPAVMEPLSGRERDVLRHAAELMSTQEIAAELHLSVNTVKTHLKSIYRKLGVARRRDAVRRAQQLDLLSPPRPLRGEGGKGGGPAPGGGLDRPAG